MLIVCFLLGRKSVRLHIYLVYVVRMPGFPPFPSPSTLHSVLVIFLASVALLLAGAASLFMIMAIC